MVYEELKADVFSYIGQNVKFVQCVSADLAMGAGIAVQFNEHFDTKNKAIKKFGKTLLKEWDSSIPAQCVEVDDVYCLITKRNYWDKPTRETMVQALMSLKTKCTLNKDAHIVMPCIGAGLDKLPFEFTRNQIKKVFENSNIHITVCVK